MASIKKVQTDSPWMKRHRFLSFAPIRNDAKVKWFVDGHGMYDTSDHNKVLCALADQCLLDYYDAIAEAILAAKSEIYIADWWLVRTLSNLFLFFIFIFYFFGSVIVLC